MVARLNRESEGAKTPPAARAAFVDALVDPAAAFSHPAEVVEHPSLSDDQKRIILLAWANDALGLEWADARDLTDFAPVARLDALLEALEQFDPKAAADYRDVRNHVRSKSARRKRKQT